MQLNKSTRTFYDGNEVSSRHVNSETPLKYMTSNPTRYFTHEAGSLDTRPTLTRKNENDYPSTALFGTAPYKLHGTPFSQKESQLIHGDLIINQKHLTEEHNYLNRIVHPTHVTPTIPTYPNSISTRNVYRNVNYSKK